jgi:hypothetical protein
MKKPTVEELIRRRNAKLAEQKEKKRKRQLKNVHRSALLYQTRRDAQMMLFGAMQTHGRIHYEMLMDTTQRYPVIKKMFKNIENRMLFILVMSYAIDLPLIFSKTLSMRMGFTFKQDFGAITSVIRMATDYGFMEKQYIKAGNKYWLNDKGREMAEWIKFRMVSKYSNAHFMSLSEYKTKLKSTCTQSVREQLREYRKKIIDRTKDV